MMAVPHVGREQLYSSRRAKNPIMTLVLEKERRASRVAYCFVMILLLGRAIAAAVGIAFADGVWGRWLGAIVCSGIALVLWKRPHIGIYIAFFYSLLTPFFIFCRPVAIGLAFIIYGNVPARAVFRSMLASVLPAEGLDLFVWFLVLVFSLTYLAHSWAHTRKARTDS